MGPFGPVIIYCAIVALLVVIIIFWIRRENAKEPERKKEHELANPRSSDLKSTLTMLYGFDETTKLIPDDAFFQKKGVYISSSSRNLSDFNSFIFAWDSSFNKFAVFKVLGSIKKFMSTTPEVYEKSQLLDYSLYKNGSMIPNGSAGSVILGGLVFGTVGAIAEAAKASTSTEMCSDLTIEIVLKNSSKPRLALPLLDRPTSTASSDYREKAEMAQEILAVLKNIKES